MTHAVDAGLLVSFASAVLFIALGVWVLTLTPRRRATVLLGAFAILFGFQFALQDLVAILDLEPVVLLGDSVPHPLWGIGWTAGVVSSLAILGLAALIPRPLEERKPLATALGVETFFATVLFVAYLVAFSPLGWWDYYIASTWWLYSVALWSAAVLVALRAAPSQDRTVDETTQLAMLAVAFGFFWIFVSGGNIPGAAWFLARGETAWAVGLGAIVGGWLTAGVVWGSNMLQAGPETVRIHRAAMLSVFGLVLVGAVLGLTAFEGVDRTLLLGVARILGGGLLAYGVLRHDIAGLDAKVEWGLSKTTVAGIFVAVFFMVSEGAQAIFADFAGNEFLGVLAAGALVFAISPLQRLADRFAAKAVPGGAQEGAGIEAQYRRAVETALADGTISSQEEHHLAELADELDISMKRAIELRDEIHGQVDEGTGGDDA